MTNKEINNITQNLKSPTFWKRLLFMALFIIAYIFAEATAWAVIIFLILYNLFTGSSNERAVTFGRQISAYIYHLLLYLTYNTEERPFPFTDWPKPEKMPVGLGRSLLTPTPDESIAKSTSSQSAAPTAEAVKSAPETTTANSTFESKESSQIE
jgi:hypothetical protein